MSSEDMPLRIDLIVAVWGDWHIMALEQAALPTYLSSGNFPALVHRYDCRLRVFTRRADVARLNRMDGLRRTAELMPLEIIVASEDEQVPPHFHLKWWHQATECAVARNAKMLTLQPDCLFAEGCLVNLCVPLEHGKKAVLAPPQLRVVSETILRELQGIDKNGVISLSPYEIVSLGMRHLHPLFGEVIAGCPVGRPGIEFLWPVDDEGFVLCQTTREIMGLDPARCEVTEVFLESAIEELSDVHVSSTSNDIFYLSLGPLMKDFDQVLPQFPVTSKFLARWSTHQQNDSRLSRSLAHQLVRLEAKETTSHRWDQVIGEARQWVSDYYCWRDVYHVWAASRARGCRRAGELIGLAAHVLDMPRLVPCDGPLTVFIPSDRAIEALEPGRLAGYVALGCEARLQQLIMQHITKGRQQTPPVGRKATVVSLGGRPVVLERNDAGELAANGVAAQEPYSVDNIDIIILNTVLEPLPD